MRFVYDDFVGSNICLKEHFQICPITVGGKIIYWFVAINLLLKPSYEK